MMLFHVVPGLKKCIICYKITLLNFLWIFIIVSPTYKEKDQVTNDSYHMIKFGRLSTNTYTRNMSSSPNIKDNYHPTL